MDAFAEFLEAKYALDQRSLNPWVWRRFLAELSGGGHPLDLLDVGTGTGSMLRRILQAVDGGVIRLTGLDLEAELLDIAETELAAILRARGFDIRHEAQHLIAGKGEDRMAFQRVCSSLTEFQCASSRFDAITAHAFMDLVPLQKILSDFYSWLQTGGLFYGTTHYDGETVLFPPYPDSDFEDVLLQAYDMSMEARRLNGAVTGGAKCGRRLYRQLLDAGFEIVCYGSSDWNITPCDGAYRDGDHVVLDRLLGWIHSEGRGNEAVDRIKLQQWLECRRQQLQDRTLGVIIHQLDILARKGQSRVGGMGVGSRLSKSMRPKAAKADRRQ